VICAHDLTKGDQSMLVKFTARKARKVRGTDIAVGDTLYAIKKGRYYFIWAYLDKDMAEWIDGIVKPKPGVNIAANWRQSLDQLTPTATKR
jgi:hypothetical protein